jgi:hypothetical protein
MFRTTNSMSTLPGYFLVSAVIIPQSWFLFHRSSLYSLLRNPLSTRLGVQYTWFNASATHQRSPVLASLRSAVLATVTFDILHTVSCFKLFPGAHRADSCALRHSTWSFRTSDYFLRGTPFCSPCVLAFLRTPLTRPA